jgi:hypothetical protein
MPYSNETAPRLGHVPVVNNQAIQEAFSRWEVVQARPDDDHGIKSLCKPLSDLVEISEASDVCFAITVDGSDSEVEATREHPTVKVGFIRVAGSFVDLDKLASSGEGAFVNPVELHHSHVESAFDMTLPGSGLVIPGQSGVDTWRQELDRFFGDIRFDDDSPLTLADALLILHGSPDRPASELTLGACPVCRAKDFASDVKLKAGKNGGRCPFCNAVLYISDALRTHEEYVPEGSNQTALTRVMLVAERLMTLSYVQHIYTTAPKPEDVFRQTLFITDGPLGLFGVVAPLKRRFQAYNDSMYRWAETKGIAAPFLVGIEKSGRFVEHAELIADMIPEGNVMMLSTEYINRMTGRAQENVYGRDEFYGRRFIYRTTSGDPLVITVPPRSGVLPYEGAGAEDFSSYPTLRTVCEVLDSVRTRLYANAVIPVALAHSSASLPLGVGHSVLRAMAQKGVGLPQNSQIRYRTNFH